VYICSFLDAVLSFRNILYLFQVVVSSEGLEDNFTLGLAALLGGDFAFLPHKTKLRKVAPVDWCGDSKKNAIPNCTFSLYLRVKFFMPSLRGVRYVSAHRTYLYQERRAELITVPFGSIILYNSFVIYCTALTNFLYFFMSHNYLYKNNKLKERESNTESNSLWLLDATKNACCIILYPEKALAVR
jgi:hypothetical protein